MNTSYTSEQRKKIYSKAAIALFRYEHDGAVCCFALNLATGYDMNSLTSPEYVHTGTLKKIFPEFALFEPNNYEERWWNGENEKECRIYALLLCSEMCE